MSNLHKTAATVSLFFAPKEKKSALRDLKEMINDYGLAEELNNAVLKKCGDLYNKLCIAWDSFRGGYGDKEELQDLQCQYNDIWEDCANNLLYAIASKKSNGLFLDKHFLHKTAMSPADIGCHKDETTPVERSTQMVGYETPTTNNFALRVAPLDGEEDKFKLEIDTDKKKDKVTVDKINPPPSVPNSSQSLLNKPEEEANSKGVGSTTYNDLFEVVDKEFPVAEIFASRSSDLFFDNYFLHKTAAPDMVHLDDGCSYDYKSDSYQDVPTVGNTMGTIPADREANELNKDYSPHAQAVHGDKAPAIKLFIDMSKDKPFSHGKDTINHLGIKFEEYDDEDIDVSFPKASQIECESSFKTTSGVVGDVKKNVKGNVKGEMKGKVTDGQGRGTKGTIGDGNSIKPTASSNVPVSDSIRFFELPQAYKEPEDIKLKLEKDGKGNGLSLSVLKPNTNKDDYSRNMSGVGNGDAPNCINDGLNQKFDMGGDTGAIGDEGFSAKTTEISGFAAEDLGKEDTWYTDKEKDSHDVDHA